MISPEFGRGSFSWATGSASWFYRVSLDHILGIRPVIDGLVIDPCIPHTWSHFEVERTFRGARYRILVKNPDRISVGIYQIKVDGELIEGNLIKPFTEGEHAVEVIMGKPKGERKVNFYR